MVMPASCAFSIFIFAIASEMRTRGFVQDSAECAPRGSVRIADGITSKLGRVEVCLASGTWSCVDAKGFDNATAKVVCSQVGHAKYGAIPFDSAFFRPSRTSIMIKNIRCLGTESNITQCLQEYYPEARNGSDAAGIYCPFVSSNCTEGSVRLVNGIDDTTGKLEICVEDVYGGVCNQNWTKSGSEVICNQLGLFSTSFGSSLAFSVSCTGMETALNHCSIRSAECADAVGVRCNDADQCIHGALRLVDGDGPNEGRVELCIRGKWRTACDDYWDSVAAEVACRQLGFPHQGVVLGKVRCGGGETSIIQCRLEELGHSECSPNEAAGLVCRANTTLCVDGDIRLSGGRSQNEGRVELCVGNHYGTVCDQSWSDADAAVVCSQLGFSRQGAIAAPKLSFGGGKGAIHLTEVNCTGDESSLSGCQSKRGSNDIYPHYRDAGVICPGVHHIQSQGHGKPNEDTPVIPPDGNEGALVPLHPIQDSYFQMANETVLSSLRITGTSIFNSGAQSYETLSNVLQTDTSHMHLHTGVTLHPGFTFGVTVHPSVILQSGVTLHPDVTLHQTQLEISHTLSSIMTGSTTDEPMPKLQMSTSTSSEDIPPEATYTPSESSGAPKVTPVSVEDELILTLKEDPGAPMVTPTLNDNQNVPELAFTSTNDQGALLITITLSGNQDVPKITLTQHVIVTSSAYLKDPRVIPSNAHLKDPMIAPSSAHLKDPRVTPSSAHLKDPRVIPSNAHLKNPEVIPSNAHLKDPGVIPSNAHLKDPGVIPSSAHLKDPMIAPSSAHLKDPRVTPSSAHLKDPGVIPSSAHPKDPMIAPSSAHLKDSRVMPSSAHLKDLRVFPSNAHLKDPEVIPSSAHLNDPRVTPNPPFDFWHRVSDATSTHAAIFVTGLSVLVSAIVL